ncbi:Serine-type D-Ala-D-Ala carboxypeptidase [Serinicoccus hydrothermalis]|uniref:Serine-type D-Ala-D-Ala carboxypeptidase n=1 Tax=Serinicoccus hydrothermalis TaxID=1758689 RepID=A0A1B1NCW0_9MICO|nr:serine hydrolase domain-containing protein [Serinicoccus hydrothermalis]ANS79205.1 Serine-type D-Ala-D-Ala carboxypeptidase [Serinicoccus hydrothermalis]
MHRRTTTIALTVALAGIPVAATAAPAPGADVDELATAAERDEELRQDVREAAATAQAQAAEMRRSTTGDLPGTARVPWSPRPALESGIDTLVADGAIGVTARVETPTLRWTGSAGERGLDGAAPALDRSPLRVASNTKTMIATLVMQEVEAGTWTLDTPVDDVIPGLFPDHPDVTVRHLLSHTSGMPLGTYELITPYVEDPEDWDDFVSAISRDYADQEHIDAVNAVPWATQPGEAYSYSNAGYVALGMLLEEATGTDVGTLVTERIRRPAGMGQSRYPDEPGLQGAALHEAMFVDELGWVGLEGFDPDVFSHSGAAVATVEDLSDLTTSLLGGDLVSSASVEQMITPSSENPMGYGLGMYALPDPCRPGEYLYGHDGATFGSLSLTFASRDGSRQVALGVTGRDLTLDQDALYDINDALVPMLLATC